MARRSRRIRRACLCEFRRDEALHQRTVRAWLLGSFLEARLRGHNFSRQNKARAAEVMIPLLRHLVEDGCLGSISEIFDGDTPHRPTGCWAQAWSVVELILGRRTVVEPTYCIPPMRSDPQPVLGILPGYRQLPCGSRMFDYGSVPSIPLSASASKASASGTKANRSSLSKAQRKSSDSNAVLGFGGSYRVIPSLAASCPRAWIWGLDSAPAVHRSVPARASPQ
jgi:hypothetical protein